MSRTRKFEIGDVALWVKAIDGTTLTQLTYYCIIVEYKQDGRGKGRYRVIRTLHPISGGTFGEPAWVNTYNLHPVYDAPNRQTAVSIYKANQKLVERGCTCNCCAHEAIPKGQIRKDGTFRWE